jgi:hypothetical protein
MYVYTCVCVCVRACIENVYRGHYDVNFGTELLGLSFEEEERSLHSTRFVPVYAPLFRVGMCVCVCVGVWVCVCVCGWVGGWVGVIVCS